MVFFSVFICVFLCLFGGVFVLIWFFFVLWGGVCVFFSRVSAFFFLPAVEAPAKVVITQLR